METAIQLVYFFTKFRLVNPISADYNCIMAKDKIQAVFTIFFFFFKFSLRPQGIPVPNLPKTIREIHAPHVLAGIQRVTLYDFPV